MQGKRNGRGLDYQMGMKYNLQDQSEQRKETKDRFVKTRKANYKEQKRIAAMPIGKHKPRNQK